MQHHAGLVGHATWFRSLELVRWHGAGVLHATGLDEQTRRRHAAHVLMRLRSVHEDLYPSALGLDLANVEEVLSWSLARPASDTDATAMAAAMASLA